VRRHPEDDKADPGRRVGRRLLLGLLLAVAVLYVAGLALASDRLPRDTTVAGVEVGGMRPERAEEVLRDRLAPRADDRMEVVVGGRTFTLNPQALGLEVDVEASVAQAPVGRSWHPGDMWEAVTGGERYEAVVVADNRLTKRLRRIAEEVREEPVEGSVDFRAGGAEPTHPEPGTALAVQRARQVVVSAYPSADEPVQLPTRAVEPEIDRREVNRFMEEVARPALSGPVTVRVEGEEAVLRPADLAAALEATADGDRLELEVDLPRLIRAIRPALPTLAPPRDATFRIVNGQPRVVPSRQGVTLDREQLGEALRDAVTSRDERVVRASTQRVRPELTTREARGLGIREQVSEFSTNYPHADYRNTNIGRAAELVQGTVLKPGETFSLNETVGERTSENGFTEGFIISDGVFKEELGGGVSQVATTLFNAMFFAGLEDVEHKPHSFYIDRYPVGREATVAWPSVDLRFRNDTDHGVLITTSQVTSSSARQGSITVRMWSTKVWDITASTGERYAATSPETRTMSGDDCVPNSGYAGFTIDVYRIFRQAGEQAVERRERFRTVYTPSDTVVCR
jgi:vancomycin resistance protein YoaR